jgi:hypothetical protein
LRNFVLGLAVYLVMVVVGCVFVSKVVKGGEAIGKHPHSVSENFG